MLNCWNTRISKACLPTSSLFAPPNLSVMPRAYPANFAAFLAPYHDMWMTAGNPAKVSKVQDGIVEELNKPENEGCLMNKAEWAKSSHHERVAVSPVFLASAKFSQIAHRL